MVYDARPKLNADANCLMGGGYEDKYYENCELVFCNIGNIHEVTKAFKQMCLLAY